MDGCDMHRRDTAEEVDLLGERRRVRDLLIQVRSQFVDGAEVLGAFDHRDVLHVLHDRLVLRREIFVEQLDEGFGVHAFRSLRDGGYPPLPRSAPQQYGRASVNRKSPSGSLQVSSTTKPASHSSSWTCPRVNFEEIS